MNDQDEMFEKATETPASLGVSAEAKGRAAEQPLGQCPQHMPKTLPSGFDGVESANHPLTPEEQSAIQREEARQKRKIHWKGYPTKVDIAVMGKTEQNGKVYEVRVNKPNDNTVTDIYGQIKVNGKIVLTASFIGGAWMLRRMLTGAAQALVNFKAKKRRDSRRNYAKRAAAAKAQEVK